MVNERGRSRKVRTYNFEVLCKRELLAADLISGPIDLNHATQAEAFPDMDLPKEPLALVQQSRSRYAAAAASRFSADVAAPALSDTFLLHSRPGATKTIYIDFNGQFVHNTLWNRQENNGNDILSPPYDPAHDGPAFSNSELLSIQKIWQRVAADYSAFDVDVTTEDPGELALVNTGNGDTHWGTRIIVTPVDFSNSGAGGFAYVGSFNWDYYLSDSTDTPGFVFNESEIGVAAAVSHEAGHTLGLSHDGTTASNPVEPNQEYYDGHGSGENGWGPIMGTGYYENVTTWDQGEYLGANNVGPNANLNHGASDLDVITTLNGFGYRPDDFGGTISTAADVDITSFPSPGVLGVSKFGNIERSSDLDFFKFQAGAGVANFTIDPYVSEFWINNTSGLNRSVQSSFFSTTYSQNQGTNLDVEAKLYNSAGTLIATSNPAGLRAKFENINLTAGTYYISIDGVGFGNPMGNPPTGYTDYDSLGQYMVTGTFVSPGVTFTPIAIDADKSEGDSGQTPFKFEIHLSTAQSSPVTVNWSVAGTGTNPANAADFGGTLPSGTVTFAPGVTSIPISVMVSGDKSLEQDETFTLSLSNPSIGQVLSSALGKIRNDDRAQILLVDDDLGANLQVYFQNALDADGFTYQTWTVAQVGLPTAPDLSKYDVVIWNTGVANTGAGAGLTSDEQLVLMAYMNGGGRVFLTGQDILSNDTVSLSFRTNYLRMTDYVSDVLRSPHSLTGVAGNPISDGMTLSLNPTPGTTIRTDAINPANGGVGIFANPPGTQGPSPYSAVAYRGNTAQDPGIVFFAFSFEDISTSATAPNNQNTVMARVIHYLSRDGYPKVAANAASIVGSEGDLITNTGTWSDADSPAASVTLTASIGQIVKHNDGTWSWSYQSSNDMGNTMVVITAVDETGKQVSTSFQFLVMNVAPTLTGNLSSVSGQVLDILTNSGTWADPGDAATLVLSASFGTVVKNDDGTWNWSIQPTRIFNNETVTIRAYDGQLTTEFNFILNAKAAATKGSVYYKSFIQDGDITPAIDTSKQMAKEGAAAQTLSYANLINDKQGITGLILEIPGLADRSLTAASFDIRMSPQGLYNVAANPPATWQLAPSPTAVIGSRVGADPLAPATVRLEWADNAIENRWLRVQVLADSHTGLTSPATFYIGHLRGELDGLIAAGSYLVTNGDYAKMQPIGGGRVTASENRDLDKNGFVINSDLLLARAAVTSQLKLRNLTIPAAAPPQTQKLQVAQKAPLISQGSILATPQIQSSTDALLKRDTMVVGTNAPVANYNSITPVIPSIPKPTNLTLAYTALLSQKTSTSKPTNDQYFAELGKSDLYVKSILSR